MNLTLILHRDSGCVPHIPILQACMAADNPEHKYLVLGLEGSAL